MKILSLILLIIGSFTLGNSQDSRFINSTISTPISGQSNQFDAMIEMPKNIYAVDGIEMNMYLQTLVNGHSNWKDLDLDFFGTIGIQYDRMWRILPLTADVGSYNLTMELRYNSISIIDTKSTTVNITSLTSGTGITRKVLVIGDSTTEGGHWTQQLLDRFNHVSDPMAISLIGTNGSGSNVHEGVSGKTYKWHARDVNSSFTFGGANTFDFAQYLSTNGFTMSANDWVIFNLGINDIGNSASDAKIAEMKADIDYMIADIKLAVPGIRIALCTTAPACEHQDAAGNNYGVNLSKSSYDRNRDKWIRELLTIYDTSIQEANDIYIIPLATNLDIDYNFPTMSILANEHNNTSLNTQSNLLHPAISGYKQMGDSVYCFLKSKQ